MYKAMTQLYFFSGTNAKVATLFAAAWCVALVLVPALV
jgi:hypothetical protein